MPPSRKLKRFLIRTGLILIAILVIITIVASPLTRYFVEKYDVKFTGREITVGRAFLNPLAGSVSLRNFRVFESESDTVFASAGKFSANISILKLLSGVYDISSIKINHPEIRIVKIDTIFNFKDLIEKFAVGKDTLEEKTLKLNLRNIRINDGTVFYSDRKIPADLTISEINFSSPGVFWDVDTITGRFSLVPGEGDFAGNFTVNKDSLDYKIEMKLAGFGLNQFEPYFDAMAGKASVIGYLNLDLNASGNIHKMAEGHGSGNFELKDIHLGPDTENDYFSLKRMLVQFRNIDIGKSVYHFDSILIDKPYILYQKYDTLDNFRRLFSTWFAKKAAEKVEEVADTVSLFVNLVGVDYYVHSFLLNDARLDFNDYSIAEKFSISVDPLNIKADTIDKADKRVKILIDGKLKPYGRFNAAMSMNPRNDKSFDFKYNIRDLAASMFNPYIASFTSYQLDHGTIEMHGDWSVQDADINARNHFLVLDPQDTKRIRGKDTKWIPLPLIMSFVRERGGVIDYQIPVKGRLNDPSFKLGDIISDILKNILIKPPTTPYRLEVRNVEKEIEKTLTVKWEMRQYDIEQGQEKFMKHIAGFLKDNPEASIVVQPVFYEEKEKENLLLFEAKKKFFFEKQNKKVSSLAKKDSMEVEKLTFKDHALKKFLDGSLKNPDLLTLQEKCRRIVGNDIIEKDYGQLIEKRREAFLGYFKDNGTDNRVEILKVKNEVPYNWFSYYDINYKGDVPESLSKAFNKLYEINSEPPRKEYFKP